MRLSEISALMKNYAILIISLMNLIAFAQEREVHSLKSHWKFHYGDHPTAHSVDFDDREWEEVKVPHDWAIKGPFDKEIDKQVVRIEQNKEQEATEKTARTGALPFIGVGWYRYGFDLDNFDQSKKVLLTFDGAMSNAQVYVNGAMVGERPYGYSYFYFDISDHINKNGRNLIAVRLENLPFSSRWYPGAGLYRKVQLIVKDRVSFEHWGHTVTTPEVSQSLARVHIESKALGQDLMLKTMIFGPEDQLLAENIENEDFAGKFIQDIPIEHPELWSPENPKLYTAELELYQGSELKDKQTVRFGIRKIAYVAGKGFLLNDSITKFKGVCLHHDLGPLGTAVNRSALKRQLRILKDMGCNAIRSAHNMPSLEQLELCDEMGFLFLAESFDEWQKPKVENGYNRHFAAWAEKDVVNLVRATRNHPSIVMWSAGNEVPDQWGAAGVKRAKWIQDIFHREDPTRPVTVGMDQVEATMASGFGALLDIPGLNYRTHLYEEAHEKFPQGFVLGSETASTVSSRGVYKFPVETGAMKQHPDLQSSSYDLEFCSWSNIPEEDFVLQDDKPWVMGEFVWTGFDYLGEPTPYDEFWPSRSSYFGISDLAGLPKDRFYLYRSRWNTKEPTLHVLPHWNWEGREGELTPVFVYTSYSSAELFVNGKSQGIQRKSKESKLHRYRLMWNDVRYEPGSLRVVAFDEQGKAVAEKSVVTAGEPKKLLLEPDRKILVANGEDISFVTVTIVDEKGNPCPTANNKLQFEVGGKGRFKGVCNGDPTSLEMFHLPTMKAFSGKLVIMVESMEEAGDIILTVNGEGLESEELELISEYEGDQ